MSSELITTTTAQDPTFHFHHGQISSPSRSLGFLCSQSPMNNRTHPDFTVGPEAPTRSGPGLTRPRLVKLRKGPNPRSSEIPKAAEHVDPGFNPFRTGQEAPGFVFVFGASGGDSERNPAAEESKSSSGEFVAEGMRKLNIDGIGVGKDEIVEDLRKMKIESKSRGEGVWTGRPGGDNVGGDRGRKAVDSELLNELDKKLSLKGGGDSSAAVATTLRDQIMSMSIEDGPQSSGLDDMSVTGEVNVENSSGGREGSGGLEEPTLGVLDAKDEFIFTSKQDYGRTPSFEFRTAGATKTTNLFSGGNEKVEFNATRDSIRDPGVRKKGGKVRGPTKVQLWLGQDFVSVDSSSQESTEAFDSYSPMEVSPYQEILAETRHSTEDSLKSDDSFSLDNDPRDDSVLKTSTNAEDEDLAMATERMDINEEMKEEHLGDDNNAGTEGALDESVSGAETESFKSANEEVDFIETEVSSSLNTEDRDAESRTNSVFATALEDQGGSNFTFSASTAAQSQSQNLASKRLQKKKNPLKFGHEINNISTNAKVSYAPSSSQFTPFSGTSLLSSPGRVQKGDLSSTVHKTTDVSDVGKTQSINIASRPTSASNVAAQEACEKWRLRGNQAYTSGELSKAEDWYTQGINCIDKTETSRSCLRALMLCYSNRAATRISLGRMRDALEDCTMAAEIDPNFLRVQVRAANCYLALGEVEDASMRFRRCLQVGSDICVDRKIAVEASEGLQKVQKLSECMNRSSELLLKKTASDVESALDVIAEALIISPCSEKLLEMKAEALFSMRRFENAIDLCEKSLDPAERNSPANTDGSNNSNYFYFRVWRCRVALKSYFQLGRLEDGLASLEKQEEKLSATYRNESKILESSIPLASTVRELLRHKAAGNEAFQAGKHTKAVERYTAALSCNVESRPFAAVCFCNRAAAFKALGQITDAIADCSLAMALDGNYLKAISRRATLYEMIRDYGQAARDLERLTSLIVKQLEEKTGQGSTNDLRQARLRLSEIEEESRKDISLDMYLILGVDPSVSTSEIKKAYRKAALRHHPDKAGQFLARSDSGDSGLWKERAEEVYKDADRLFKMIGEAYTVLSDPNKRTRYDAEEEMRSALKKRNGSSTPRAQTEARNFASERSGIRRPYATSPTTTWSEASRSNRYS